LSQISRRGAGCRVKRERPLAHLAQSKLWEMAGC